MHDKLFETCTCYTRFQKGFFRGRGKGSGISGDICSQRDYSKPKDEAVTLISDALATFFCPLDKITFFS